MFEFLRDSWQSLCLSARYRRLAQERVLQLLEAAGSGPFAVPTSEDSVGWTLVGGGKATPDPLQRIDLRSEARRLAQSNPYARNILRLLEVYVAGPGLRISAAPVDPDVADEPLQRRCDRLWSDFLRQNRRHFTFRETVRRTWRDGECFLRMYPQAVWPPTVRYVDPEAIAGAPDGSDGDGLLTADDDVEAVVAYQRVHPATGVAVETIPAREMLHIKLGVDSNERRGVSVLAPVLETLRCYDHWLDTELQARKLQSSIVLWRKVHGGPSQVSAIAQQQSDGQAAIDGSRRERYRPGTILTTSHGTDLQFLQPNTNFGDAVPLGRLVLLGIAAGAGIPEFMLIGDAAHANFASTMVAEGPAVKLFESEQQFFAAELEPLWRWVMQEAIALGALPVDVLERVTPQWSFPQLVNRDRAKERLADVQLIDAGVLSRAEIARRENVDPATMQAELQAEAAALEDRTVRESQHSASILDRLRCPSATRQSRPSAPPGSTPDGRRPTH